MTREGWELDLRGNDEPVAAVVVVRRSAAAASLAWPAIGLVCCIGWLSFRGTFFADRPIRTTERVDALLAAVDVDAIIARRHGPSQLFTLGRMIVCPWLWVDIFGIRDRVHIVVGPVGSTSAFFSGLVLWAVGPVLSELIRLLGPGMVLGFPTGG
jgi:hypothetical protein